MECVSLFLVCGFVYVAYKLMPHLRSWIRDMTTITEREECRKQLQAKRLEEDRLDLERQELERQSNMPNDPGSNPSGG